MTEHHQLAQQFAKRRHYDNNYTKHTNKTMPKQLAQPFHGSITTFFSNYNSEKSNSKSEKKKDDFSDVKRYVHFKHLHVYMYTFCILQSYSL